MPKKSKVHAKETEESIAGQDICSRCALSKEEWSANRGKGFKSKGEIYCCEGCAEDTGCTCENDQDLSEGDN